MILYVFELYYVLYIVYYAYILFNYTVIYWPRDMLSIILHVTCIHHF